jgi:DNA mismatch endonuclease (patch repair protein)
MADVFSSKKRSEIMSRVKSSGNRATEGRLIRIMRESGLKGWRRNFALFGKPDFVFPKARLAIFVDGCFWHGCPQHKSAPASNTEFWTAKLERNADRDRLVNRTLAKAGWSVVRIWQHDLKRQKIVVKRLSQHLSLGGGA